jgi:alanine-glyoxylate transaminase/serine-glyoxylate transaminase/serine-pyruvate transaminase
LDRIAGAFSDMCKQPELNQIHRYEGRLNHAYQRALQNLFFFAAAEDSDGEAEGANYQTNLDSNNKSVIIDLPPNTFCEGIWGETRMAYQPGRHFLQIPGPTNVPDRILRAIDRPTIDHRGPEFTDLAKQCLEGMKTIFQTKHPVIIYPASGTGAWEAALVNTLSPGDKVLAFDTGQFAVLWTKVARNLGLQVDLVDSDWRMGVEIPSLAARLDDDRDHQIKAVMVVHSETSTGVACDIAEVRRAMNDAMHPALLMVDTVSSLAVMDYRHDEWGEDVAISGSQKGMMLPPGLSFNAISPRALAAARSSKLPKSFWRWDDMLEFNAKGFFPYTPATNMLCGLREALKMLGEEGLQNVFCRHLRFAEATSRAVQAWGLELLARDGAKRSSALTAVYVPDGFNEAELRALILEKFNMSLGAGLGKLAGRVFRIGHLGDLNALMLAGTLSGVEMGLELAGIPHHKGGVAAALAYLCQVPRP